MGAQPGEAEGGVMARTPSWADEDDDEPRVGMYIDPAWKRQSLRNPHDLSLTAAHLEIDFTDQDDNPYEEEDED